MLAMTCRELADFLMDYVDGGLPADVRTAFDRHLTRCPNCVAYVKTYRTTIELGRRAFNDDQTDAALTGVPADLIRAILAATKAGPSV
jgi:anti-sigma factor RsiW